MQHATQTAPTNRIAIASAFAAALSAFSLPAMAAGDPTGVWYNSTKRGAIEIKECGNRLCGHVIWTSSNSDAKGCGRQIIGNLRQVGKNLWDKGWVYSPERKRRYDVEVKPLSGDRLRIKGYAGSKFFSKTKIWTRAPDNLQRCDGAPPAVNEQIAKVSNDAAPIATSRSAGVSETRDAKVEREQASAAKSAQAVESKPRRAEVEPEPRREERPVQRNDRDDAYENENDDNDGGRDIGNINIDKYFSRDSNGRCKVDTPWVKLRFHCGDRLGSVDSDGLLGRLKDAVGNRLPRNDEEGETQANIANDVAENVPSPSRKPETKVADLDKAQVKTCKKFIASANITVTVPCAE